MFLSFFTVPDGILFSRMNVFFIRLLSKTLNYYILFFLASRGFRKISPKISLKLFATLSTRMFSEALNDFTDLLPIFFIFLCFTVCCEIFVTVPEKLTSRSTRFIPRFPLNFINFFFSFPYDFCLYSSRNISEWCLSFFYQCSFWYFPIFRTKNFSQKFCRRVITNPPATTGVFLKFLKFLHSGIFLCFLQCFRISCGDYFGNFVGAFSGLFHK